MSRSPKESPRTPVQNRAEPHFVPERDLVLLLTATIRPNPSFDIAGAPNAEDRSAQYAQALAYALRHYREIQSIVLAENSGADLEALRRVAEDNPQGKTVEFVSFSANEFPPHFSKADAESDLIDRTLDRSEELAAHSHFAKLTGRLWIRNLAKLLSRAPWNLLLYADARDHRIYERLGLSASANYLDTRFFIAQHDFYCDHFRHLHLIRSRKGNTQLKSSFLEAAEALGSLPGVWLRFPVEPAFRGRAAHWRKSYSGPKERLKRSIRSVTRRVLPGLKI